MFWSQAQCAQPGLEKQPQCVPAGWVHMYCIRRLLGQSVPGEPVAHRDEGEAIRGGDRSQLGINFGSAAAPIALAAGQRSDHCHPGSRAAGPESSEQPLRVNKPRAAPGRSSTPCIAASSPWRGQPSTGCPAGPQTWAMVERREGTPQLTRRLVRTSRSRFRIRQSRSRPWVLASPTFVLAGYEQGNLVAQRGNGQ